MQASCAACTLFLLDCRGASTLVLVCCSSCWSSCYEPAPCPEIACHCHRKQHARREQTCCSRYSAMAGLRRCTPAARALPFLGCTATAASTCGQVTHLGHLVARCKLMGFACQILWGRYLLLSRSRLRHCSHPCLVCPLRVHGPSQAVNPCQTFAARQTVWAHQGSEVLFSFGEAGWDSCRC